MTHISSQALDRRCDQEQSFYKKTVKISDDLVRNRIGFWANILQKRDSNTNGSGEPRPAAFNPKRKKAPIGIGGSGGILTIFAHKHVQNLSESFHRYLAGSGCASDVAVS